LRTVDATIAFERRRGLAFRYWRGRSLSCRCVWSRCLNDRLGFNATLVFGVAIPPERSNDEQNYQALHMIDPLVKKGLTFRFRRAGRRRLQPVVRPAARPSERMRSHLLLCHGAFWPRALRVDVAEWSARQPA